MEENKKINIPSNTKIVIRVNRIVTELWAHKWKEKDKQNNYSKTDSSWSNVKQSS